MQGVSGSNPLRSTSLDPQRVMDFDPWKKAFLGTKVGTNPDVFIVV
jgi:hypothetical protein